jgi:aminoglycoside phosphotransferase (APT) family kinase protein
MKEIEEFNPNHNFTQVETYLQRSLGKQVRLIEAERLVKSSRDAPWRLDVEVDGALQLYVLRLDARHGEHEFTVLRAMESIPIPTPGVYGWDPDGLAFGIPCFLIDFIEGESLLQPMLAGESWAESLYIDTVCALQSITREQLSMCEDRLSGGETATDVLEAAYTYLKETSDPLVEAVYSKLKETMPVLPATRFSNGDLWLDNFIVRGKQLVGVIDFQHAGFSDPIFEFLLSFFASPELRDKGTEERYCQRMGFDPHMLNWYHGLEYFDTWHWVLKSGEPFVHHTAESLSAAAKQWLFEG